MPAPIDLRGKFFGRLTVIRLEKVRNGKRVWLCRCLCGRKASIASDKLRSGHSRSCGCLQREAVAESKKKHGLRNIPEYRVWLNIRNRCNNPRTPAYKNYGARGIKVCPEWDDFAVFIADMGRRPSPELTVERKDNDKGYSKQNCKWATRLEQARNSRRWK